MSNIKVVKEPRPGDVTDPWWVVYKKNKYRGWTQIITFYNEQEAIDYAKKYKEVEVEQVWP